MFVENAMGNIKFLFVIKGKIKIPWPIKFVDESNIILLKSTRGDVVNNETKSSVKTYILFDTGLQRRYVNEKVRKHLNLKKIRTEKALIKTFCQIFNSMVKLMILKCKMLFKRIVEKNYDLVAPVICRPL